MCCCRFALFMAILYSVSGAPAQPALSEQGRPDARTITLTDVVEVDAEGKYPRFSPDGRRLLYEKDWAIWMMNRDGSGKQLLLNKASTGSWSPDGRRIAYCNASSMVCVLDLESRQTFELVPIRSLRNARISWSKDGAKLYIWELPLDDSETIALDLESLETTTHHVPDRYTWLVNNTTETLVPGVWLMAEHSVPLGIWAFEVEGEFRQLVHPGYWDRVSIAPDLSSVAFGKVVVSGGGISVARIGTRSEGLDKTFRVALGEAELAGVFSFMGIQDLQRCRREGDLYATIYGPHVNPLTGRTVGPGEEKKGIVKFTDVRADRSQVRIVESLEPIGPGDVLARPWTGRINTTMCSSGAWEGWVQLEELEVVPLAGPDRPPESTSTQALEVVPSGDLTARGNWNGVASHEGLKFPIVMRLTSLEGVGKDLEVGTIEYPTLSCGGKIMFLGIASGSRYIFREVILRGAAQCVSGGRIEVELIDANSMRWSWFFPDGGRATEAALTRAVK